MTYAELGRKIAQMSVEQQKLDATVYVALADEFYPIVNLGVTDGAPDVLDANHPFLEAELLSFGSE